MYADTISLTQHGQEGEKNWNDKGAMEEEVRRSSSLL